MGKYVIKGGNVLNGEISISGAKNAVLPIIASSILNKKTCIIHNCPRISDTFLSIQILQHLGCEVEFTGNTLFIDSSSLNCTSIPQNYVEPMRSSIIFLGSLVGRTNECTIGYPGGCELGKRPIDLHLFGLRELGVDIIENEQGLQASTTKLSAKNITLSFPSVGATENILLASVYADGTTTLNNPAREPEIVEMQNFLNAMGAKISGAGTNKITIEGVKELNDVEYTVFPDRIVTGTYIAGILMTKGEAVFNNISFETIESYKNYFEEVGAIFQEVDDNSIYVKSPKILKPIEKIETLPHPGFPTDMQSQFVAMLSIANGESTMIENIFESRTKHIDELIKMGAQIEVLENQKVFKIRGVNALEGIEVNAKDLRGGAALVLAGLVADGTTIVNNAHYIQRGYESIDYDFEKLGANIKYISDNYERIISA